MQHDNAQVIIDTDSICYHLFPKGASPERALLARKLQGIQERLDRANPDERLELATRLVRTWVHGTYEELRETLGDCWKLKSICRAMLSVTADGRQLRVWYGFPNGASSNHVDSCGRNLLLDVSGGRNQVHPYTQAFLAIERMVATPLKGGSTLYTAF